MNTDPIADLLTRIRNAVKARHRKVDVPPSHMKISIVEIWKKTGFIRDYRLYRHEERGILRIYLKYIGKNAPVIHGIKRISRPGRRLYASYEKLPKVLGGMGVAIVSTSKGILSDHDAHQNRVGGEVLCGIW